MKRIQNIVLQNLWFFLLITVIAFTMLLVILLLNKGQAFIMLNPLHTPELALLFNFVTFLGDGSFILTLSALLLIFSKKYSKTAYLIIISFLLSGIVAQLLKSFIHSPRPAVYFSEHHINYYLDTFAHSRVGWKSFPSGHTASVFALATVISVHTRRKYMYIICIVTATLTGYSRIYLGHHFLTDVLGGCIIGVSCAVASILWYKPIKKTIITPVKNTLSAKLLRNSRSTSITTDV